MTSSALARLQQHNPVKRSALLYMAAAMACETAGTDDGIDKTLVRKYVLSTDMEVRTELWAATWTGSPPCKIMSAYTVDGHYVGDVSFAKYLTGLGIKPELKTPQSNVCSVGYSRVRNSWSGWSHRALAEFSIGDRLFQEDYGDDQTLFTQHGPTVITTLAQAREAAVAFADYVS